MRYPLAEHTIGQDDLQDLIEWLKTDPWLTQGPLVREFEHIWGKWLGTRWATFVNSGSSANLLMYYAMQLSGRLRNTKVIVPSVSWSTTVSPAIQLGFQPIMCEADWTTFGLDLGHLRELLIDHEPGAVVVVHVLGVPSDMDPLLELKGKHGFALMEDACAATGSKVEERLVGTFGDISTFSFFYGHHLSTIEGGMVCTEDEELHDILLNIRSHGWPKDLAPEKEGKRALDHNVTEFNRRFTFYHPGFNVRSTDLNARIGLTQMRKLDHVIKQRVENHLLYQSRFADTTFHYQRNDRATICSIAFGLLARSPEHRREIAKILDAKGVETRPIGGGNMSRQPFWTSRYGANEFPTADRIHTTGFQLPNHHRLGPEDVQYICDAVLSVGE